MLPILFCNSTGEIFLLITIQELCYVFVFLGFLTLLANFGLVAPIPDGIRVLGVETPLRSRELGHKTKTILFSFLFFCIFLS